MFERFGRKTLDVRDVGIACAIGGSGAPVRLLHGNPQCMAVVSSRR
jgi:hypothetical protein